MEAENRMGQALSTSGVAGNMTEFTTTNCAGSTPSEAIDLDGDSSVATFMDSYVVYSYLCKHGLHVTPAHYMSNGGTKRYRYEVIAPKSRCGTNSRFLNAHNSFDPRHGRGGNWIVLRMCHVLLD